MLECYGAGAVAVTATGGEGALHGACGAELVLRFLDALVADEGADDEGVCDGSREEDLDAGPKGAVVLGTMVAEDGGHAAEGDADGDEGEAEEQCEHGFAWERHVRVEDEGDGEDDEEEVGRYVGYGHGDELGVALSAFGAGVGDDLPVVRDGAALDEVGDYDGNHGCAEVVVHEP